MSNARKLFALALLLAMALLLCRPSQAQPAIAREEPAPQATAAAWPEFVEALKAAASGKGSLADVVVSASAIEENFKATVYGSGVGFIGTFQIRPTAEQVRGLLAKIEKAGFAAMPASIGGMRANPMMRMPVRLVRSLSVKIGPNAHEVTQLEGGEQSEALLALVKDIGEELHPLTKTGLDLSKLSLTEALRGASKGDVAPEALSLLVHYTARKGADAFWGMQIADGRIALLGPDAARTEVAAAPEMFKRLCALLADRDAEHLPIQLYHPTGMVNLGVSVLGVARNVNMSADIFPYNQERMKDNPDAQKSFDAILDGLTKIHKELKAAKTRP